MRLLADEATGTFSENQITDWTSFFRDETNQRKYTNVMSAFLALFGYAGRNFVSDPNDASGPPTIAVPADVTADKKPLYPNNCGAGVAFTSTNTNAMDPVWRPVKVRVAVNVAVGGRLSST